MLKESGFTTRKGMTISTHDIVPENEALTKEHIKNRMKEYESIHPKEKIIIDEKIENTEDSQKEKKIKKEL